MTALFFSLVILDRENISEDVSEDWVKTVSEFPGLAEEASFWQAGLPLVAGVDEAGRGAMAGPVVAAAVILPTHVPVDDLLRLLEGVRDSKLLTPKQREAFYEKIHTVALAVGVGSASPVMIDVFGIVRATQIAMARAVRRLSHVPDALLLDAITLPQLAIPQRSIIRGDQLSLSIAAASIVAKVTRDQQMIDLDVQYPGYGLARHKGYVTQAHRLAVHRKGPTPIHRYSYQPVKQAFEQRAHRYGHLPDLHIGEQGSGT